MSCCPSALCVGAVGVRCCGNSCLLCVVRCVWFVACFCAAVVNCCVMCCACWLLICVRCVFVVVACRGSLFSNGCWLVVRCVVRCLLLFVVLVCCLLLCAVCCWMMFVVVVRCTLSVAYWLFLLSHVYYICPLVIMCCLSYVGAGV